MQGIILNKPRFRQFCFLAVGSLWLCRSSEADTQQYPPEALTIKLATKNFSSDFYILNTLLNKHIISL